MPPSPALPDFVWIQEVVFPLVGMAMGFLAIFLVYKTINRWLDRRHQRTLAAAEAGDVRALVGELRDRIAAMEDVDRRLGEVEERLDFVERVLVRGRDRAALPPEG